MDEPRLMESFRRARWIQVWAPDPATTGGGGDEWIVPEGMHTAADHHRTLVEAIRSLPADSLPQLALRLFEQTQLRVV